MSHMIPKSLNAFKLFNVIERHVVIILKWSLSCQVCLVKLIFFFKSEKNSVWPDPTHSPPIHLFGNMYKKTHRKQNKTQNLKKINVTVSSYLFIYFSRFYLFIRSFIYSFIHFFVNIEVWPTDGEGVSIVLVSCFLYVQQIIIACFIVHKVQNLICYRIFKRP